MTPTTIDVSRNGSALVIRFNRPERRNALSAQMMREIGEALEASEAEANIRAVIITGGSEFFSAGADLNEAVKATSPKDVLAFVDIFHRLADIIERLSKPVIAAIEGFCMTGGCELALACDIRVAGKGSSFAITSSRIGTVAGFGGTQRLPRIVGPAHAMEMLFAAESISAEEAYRIGLVNRLTEQGGAITEALNMVSVYENRAPMGLDFAKRAVRQGMTMGLPAAIEFEKFLVATIYGTQDKLEGMSAFLEKRKATFKGR